MKALNVSLLSCALVVAAGCSGTLAAPSPTVKPAPSPTPSPVVTPSATANTAFDVQVYPSEEPVESRVAIPGEKVSFLVVVTSAASDAVSVTATATGAHISDIKPAELKPGVVGEVWLTPDATESEATAHIAITLTRGTMVKTVERTVKVAPMLDERAKDAQPYFELWVDYLIKQHPELGITSQTKWDPTFVSTFLVVSHYAYYSDEWEMKVCWHNMIPPYDWTEVYLRHRGTEWKPSLDFKIDSVSGKTAPYATTPPDAVMR